MKPYYEDNSIKIYNGDARDMSELPDNSIQCVVTSPPYWGLRKYSGEQELIWGVKEDCQHEWGKDIGKIIRKESPGVGAKQEINASQGNICSLCDAWKGAYGLEPTPEMYVHHTIEILREIRRVLRSDGVVFWNIGDSYMSHAGDRAKVGGFQANPNKARLEAESSMAMKKQTTNILKDKDLCLIPFRVAISAQEDGWYIRSVIIWAKPNPMPESVTDRPTESHEYILMLTKSKNYYWDQEAVRTPYLPQSIERSQYPVGAFGSAIGSNEIRGAGKLGARKMIRLAQRGYKTKRTGRDANNPELGNRNFMPIQGEQYHGQNIVESASGSNLRSVWTFSTQSFAGAHFATYPEKLVELCVKAATPEVGCCSKCGKPWVRITKHESIPTRPGYETKREGQELEIQGVNIKYRLVPQIETLGWQPQCQCNADKIASIVLDPFAGSGTTGWVAKKLNRRCVMYELSEEYCALALDRNRQQGLL